MMEFADEIRKEPRIVQMCFIKYYFLQIAVVKKDSIPMKNLLLLLLLLLLTGNEEKGTKVIVLQPFGDFPKAEAQIVFDKIRKVNPNVVLRSTVPFPEKSYYKPRNRYRADILIAELSKKAGRDTVIVGLSHRDISTTKGKIYDWGVMGLGYKPGNSCVVSTFRLAKKNKSEQFYKVVLHELGHTQGLPHCPVKTCLMRDAEGGNPLNDEKDFCPSCRTKLKEKRWKLNNL